MQIINTNNINQARKQIQELKKQKKPVIIKAQDEEFNRKILEIPGIDVLFAPEVHDRIDSLKQRDSGLNEFLTKLAAKNNIKIAIDLTNLKKSDKKQKAILLSRIMQNIMLCKKAKAQIIVLPEQKNPDFFAFMQALGY